MKRLQRIGLAVFILFAKLAAVNNYAYLWKNS